MAQKEKSSKPKDKEERWIHLYDVARCRDLFSTARLLRHADEFSKSPPEALPPAVPRPIAASLTSASSKQCSYCKVEFESVDDQRLHYKLDWHRFNLKRTLDGRPALPETEFNQMVSRQEKSKDNIVSRQEESKDDVADDLASISGSESEDEEEEDSSSEEEADSGGCVVARLPRLYFVIVSVGGEGGGGAVGGGGGAVGEGAGGDGGKCFSIYRTLLVDPKKRDLPSDEELKQSLSSSLHRNRWAIFMVGGGHFAGAIFTGSEVVVHKTFHCYTVRAKQGGSQSAADGRSGGSHAKSAGASLRRYNELALVQHVQDITRQWAEDLAACHLLFYRAASNSRTVLFGGKQPALLKSDPRLRTIPFPTKRATFSEVKRVHEMLSRLELFASQQEAVAPLLANIGNRPRARKAAKSRSTIHRSKSRSSPVRELPGFSDQYAGGDDEDDLEQEEGSLVLSTMVSHTRQLAEFDSTSHKKKRGKRKNNKKAGMEAELRDLELVSSGDDGEEESEESMPRTEEVKRLNFLLTAVRTGNLKLLEEAVTSCQEAEEEKEEEEGAGKEKVQQLVRKTFGDTKLTSLHLAAEGGHRAVVLRLLELGADPCARDKQKRVPYTFAKDKETRNAFRKFRSIHPDSYDWKEAQVPPPLTQAEEEERDRREKERRQAKRQEKKEKEKAVKEDERRRREQEAEKERYLALSDREKRALAAERRILAASQSGTGTSSATVLLRCFNCALDITGKVPFAYSDNSFCSTACVKIHRQK